MLRLNASYSMKVPGREEYSSQGYMCAVELEMSDNLDPAALNAKIHETFALVRSSVEAELAGNRNRAEPDNGNTVPMAVPNGNGKASNKQTRYIMNLAGDRGITLSRLNERLAERFGVGSVYELTRQQASLVLDELKRNGHRQAA